MSMDYEKAYKDALERAKEIHDSPNASSGRKEWLESTFPELAESEDERIRKEIIEHFLPHKNEPLVKKWIAYLEKQKERKHAGWSEEEKYVDFEKEIREYEDAHQVNLTGSILMGYAEDFARHFYNIALNIKK